MKALKIFILLGFVSMFFIASCEDYEIGVEEPKKKKKTDEGYQMSPEELELQRQDNLQRERFSRLQSRESVMAVVNKFFDAINREDQQAFLSCMNINEMLTYYVDQKKSYTKEEFLKYLDVKEAHKVFAFYNWKMNPKYEQVFYEREIPNDPNVGYACYNLTPKKKYVELYDSKKTFVNIRLKINNEEYKWEIVNMNFPKEFNLLRPVTVTIQGETHWEVWRYRLPLEEYVKFMRNHKSDENYYVPPDKYKIRWLKTLQPLDEGRPEIEIVNDPFAGIKIPEMISNIVLESKQEGLIGRVKSGLVGTWRDFDALRDKNRDVVGALINLIIISAQDRFKDTEKRNAALEANKVLQKLYGKDSGRERFVYGLSVGEMSTNEDKAESIGIIDKWIELFDKSGWEK